MDVVKIGVVTDVHQGPLDISPYLRRFVYDMNENFHPDIVIDLGDFLGYPAGEKELKLINSVFSECEAPRYHTLGNHDVASVGRQRFKEITGMRDYWMSMTIGFLHVILLDGAWGRWGPDIGAGPSGHIIREELEWLKRDLEGLPEDQPIIIFCHYPVGYPRILTGEGALDNEDELMGILRGYNLIATFGGHHHYGGYKEIDGVHHICLYSMGWWVEEKITGSYAKITVTPDRLIVNGEGSQIDYGFRLDCKRRSLQHHGG